MKNYIAIRLTEDQKHSEYWKVIETKFDRQPGDLMIVDGKKFVVMTSGTRELCIEVMNFSYARNMQHRRNGIVPMTPEGVRIERDLIK